MSSLTEKMNNVEKLEQADTIHETIQNYRAIAANALSIVMSQANRTAWSGSDMDALDAIAKILSRVSQVIATDALNPSVEEGGKNTDELVKIFTDALNTESINEKQSNKSHKPSLSL